MQPRRAQGRRRPQLRRPGRAQLLAFACTGFTGSVKVLYVDEEKELAYPQMTPYQSHTIWALQAAGVQLWGERYGASSDELPAMEPARRQSDRGRPPDHDALRHAQAV